MTHAIKCWRPYFERLLFGQKNFEVRKDDKDYQVDDILEICEYDNIKNEYTGRSCTREIIYKLSGGKFGIEEGYCVLGLKE